MDKLKICNKNIYHSFKYSPYSIETALVEFLNNSINAINKQINNDNSSNPNPTIIVNWDIDNDWIQVIDNGPGIDIEKEEDIFSTFSDKNKFKIGLKAAGFWLGNTITIESKLLEEGKAFIAALNLLNDNDYADFKKCSNNDILRSFKSATRITIGNITRKSNALILSNIYDNLYLAMNKYIKKMNLNIFLVIIKNKKFHDISTGNLIEVPNLNSIKKLASKTDENKFEQISLNGTFSCSLKEFNVNGYAYKNLNNNNKSGFNIYKGNQLIIGTNFLYKPEDFNDEYKNINGEILIDNVDINLTKNNFLWDPLIKAEFDNYIINKVSMLKTEIETPIIDLVDIEENDSKNNLLETAKLFLTKALEESIEGSKFEEIQTFKNKLKFIYNADDGKKITINLIRVKNKEMNGEWIKLTPLVDEPEEQLYEFDVSFNYQHPFFNEFNKVKEYSYRIEHFVICYAISETLCRLDGLSPKDMKYEINKLLRNNSNDIE